MNYFLQMFRIMIKFAYCKRKKQKNHRTKK